MNQLKWVYIDDTPPLLIGSFKKSEVKEKSGGDSSGENTALFWFREDSHLLVF